MAEKQKGSKAGAQPGPIRLKRVGNRSFRTAQAGGKAKAGKGGKSATGRVRLRRNEAAYARAAEARSQRVQSEIQAALDAANRIREQIEAKIEQRFKEHKEGPREEPREARAMDTGERSDKRAGQGRKK